jgi:hypothetical protein
MKLRFYLVMQILLLFGITTFCHAQEWPPEFSRLLAQNSLVFSLPHGFTQVPVVANRDVQYDFAIESKSEKLEIRYRIIPIGWYKMSANMDASMMYHAMISAMAMNISNGKLPQTHDFPITSVREEFGADAGSMAAVSCDSDFGKGFQKCMINVIHKDKVADAYIFFLFDDVRVLNAALMTDEIYHALRFQR